MRPILYLDSDEIRKTIRFCHNVNDTIEKLADNIVDLYTEGKKMRDPTQSISLNPIKVDKETLITK